MNIYLLLNVYPFYFIPAVLELVLTTYYLDYRTILSTCTFSITGIFNSFSCSQRAYPILASVENLFTSPLAWNIFMTPIARGVKSKLCSSASALPLFHRIFPNFYFPGGTTFSQTPWHLEVLFLESISLIFLCLSHTCFSESAKLSLHTSIPLYLFRAHWTFVQHAYLYLWHVIFTIFQIFVMCID